MGETEKTLRERIKQHVGYVRNKKLDQATGEHFNLPGHSINDFSVTVVMKIYSSDDRMRKQKEHELINSMGTKHRGMNKKS